MFTRMSADFQVVGDNAEALFTLKVHRGDGMALLAMDWKEGKPPNDFVGFEIAYREPGNDRFFVLLNRLSFQRADGSVDPTMRPRSEEHTSELQSRQYLVCRLLLEKKNNSY